MRCSTSCAALALLAAVVLAGCERTSTHATTPIALYFTCDTNGRIEPCGCFTGQHGGLTRLKSYLSEAAPPRRVLVDVGNAIEGPADYQVIKYRYLQRAYGEMGYAALNVGLREA